MNSKYLKILMVFIISISFGVISPAFANDAESRATDALTSILFDHEAESFTTYKISNKGFVDITFANNTPDLIYSLILNKSLRHPDIKGVLAGRGGPTCSSFR